MRVARYVLQLALGIALPLLVQLADRRWRLTEEQRERGWNGASWVAALYAFGPLSMLGWYFVTRKRNPAHGRPQRLVRGAGAIAAGIGVAAVIAFAIGLASDGVSSVLGLPEP